MIASGVLLTAVIAFGTAILVSNLRDRALADAKRLLDTTAYIIAEHLEGTFQSVELVQRGVIERMQSVGIASSGDLDRRMSGFDTHSMLADMIGGTPQLDALVLIDPSGRLVSSSRSWPMSDTREEGREYFRALASDASLNLFLSEPARSRRTGAWTAYLARRLVGPDGEYIGIIVGVMELRHFEQFFSSIAIGKDVAIALFRSDGRLLARDPHVEAAIGKSGGPDILFQDTWSVADGQVQLDALQALTHYPAVVSVSTTASAALAQWLQEAKIIIGAVGLAALSIGAFILLTVGRLMQGLRRSRQRLHRQKLQLDTALNNMSQGLLMCDSENRVVLCNRRYMQIYRVPAEMLARGCTRDDLIAHHYATGLLAGDTGQHLAALAQGAVAKPFYTKETETTDGHTIFINNRSVEGGFRVSTHEDITDRRRAEQERDRSRDFLDRIVEHIPVTVFVKDARSLQYILVNRAGEKLWGLSREEVIGKTPHEIFDKATADTIVRHDREMSHKQGELNVPEHFINTPRNGVRLVTSSRICVRDRNGEAQYLLGVTEDITERKGVEEQLRQAQKMEAVGNMTGGVAHDFNNLLTVIIGNLDLLLEDVAGNDAAEQKIETILQASERGADLTRLMLAFSRRQPLQSKPVDVNQLIRNTARLLNRTLGEDISIEVQPGTDVQRALVDESQLETALLNISINARDAMPEGGALTITTSNAELDADYAAHHPGVVPGTYVQIEIADTGVGMPPDVLERIFEPFFTTKAAEKGTGLGLSMVYGFMKQSSGHISVYSEVGEGTVFKLFLPLAQPEDSHAEPTSRLSESTARHSGDAVILAVDDNPDVRATVVVQLKGLGYRVREADSAHSALEILDSMDRIDLLFTDVVMPGGLSGKELATKACAKRSGLKVLFTSGFPGTATGPGTKFDEGDVLLSKPYRKRDLAEAVEAILTASP
ncbi:MAG TPA: PAS-domain containing protein [Xanthobacteraceae bacterium]|nr:PAS-domain containing protein [Xanthobacteraceae bacterium]